MIEHYINNMGGQLVDSRVSARKTFRTPPLEGGTKKIVTLLPSNAAKYYWPAR